MPEEDEFDLSKDMDEILDSDAEDSDSDQFEEIAAPTPIPPPQVSSLPVTPSLPLTPSLHPPSPSIPLNLALPSTPTSSIIHTSSPTIVHAPSPTTTTVKKRKLASAPIRHPGIISPVIKAEDNHKRQKSEHESSSGSEEESSSGSESGSTESSSGESESESGSSSDDDFESLAQDISMSLSKGGPSAPASPQRMVTHTPGHTPTPSTRQPSSQGAPAPMSLRALFSKFKYRKSLFIFFAKPRGYIRTFFF